MRCNMIAIIDYGAGNIHSIAKALEHVGGNVHVTDDAATVARASAVVLPGVGSGGAAMARMRQHGLDDAIREATRAGRDWAGGVMGGWGRTGFVAAIGEARRGVRLFLGIGLGLNLREGIKVEARRVVWDFFQVGCVVIPLAPKFLIWVGIRCDRCA